MGQSSPEDELRKTGYEARIAARAASRAFDRQLDKSDFDSDLASLQALHQTMLDVAKGSIDRSRAAAESARNAAAAIGVIYAALIGVAFSVDKPLPPRGVIPAIFLGLSIVFATAYVAFVLPDRETTPWPKQGVSYLDDLEERTAFFVDWVTESTYRHAYAIRAAVLALGFGVAFLPVSFIALGAQPSPAVADAQLIPFPEPPKVVTDTTKIRYQAEVDDVRERRDAVREQSKEELSKSPGESFDDGWVRAIWASAAAALGVVILHPLLGWLWSLIAGLVRWALDQGRRFIGSALKHGRRLIGWLGEDTA